MTGMVAHPDPEFTADLRDLSAYPPVVYFMQAGQGAFEFVDEQGVAWRSVVKKMDNGWGAVIQQQAAEQDQALRTFQLISWIATALGALLIAGLVGLVLRNALRPVETLTAAAQSIAAGDLTVSVPVRSQDEIGVLAKAFNTMTGQLRALVGQLELRVAERTQALETSAAVSRQLSTFLDVGELTKAILKICTGLSTFTMCRFISGCKHENLVLAAGSAKPPDVAGCQAWVPADAAWWGAAETNQPVVVPDTAR
jgi:HAMP domain-containing protein